MRGAGTQAQAAHTPAGTLTLTLTLTKTLALTLTLTLTLTLSLTLTLTPTLSHRQALLAEDHRVVPHGVERVDLVRGRARLRARVTVTV